MIPSSNKNLRYYYSIEGLKSNYIYQDTIMVYTNEIYVNGGFGIKSLEYDKTTNTVSVIYNFYYYDTLDQSIITNDILNNAIRNNIQNLKTDYQKALWAYQWILDNVHYDDTLLYFSAYDGLQSNGTVCVGYATLYSSLVNKLGLDCRIVEGFVRDNKTITHAWNFIKLDGKWYCVDPTWGDAGNKDKYFLKSVDTFASSDYGYHDSPSYDYYIEAGEIFADTDYVDDCSSEHHSLMPSVYNVKIDVLKINVLNIDETYKFMLDNPDNIEMIFTSSNSDVVTIDENGIAIGVGAGETTIVAYNEELDIKQTCKITVIE
jgi:hypothetical protein